MTSEDRLVNIELKIAAQEDLVDTLNRQVYRQQKKIDELETLCAVLARQLREVRETMTERGPANEKPPHY
ncbi:SlyX family protein [Noviherbaspirillum denitrificans]|uniref:SlyX protein n=1 Tax=Noviherbaspirillum denitrificans TaxID=1968433 RepID=A0A254TJ46_9BURK|nr:SlyX family protein [Noviherbaspirillum denitrificans]OWW22651.1 SlyX protein [Noviherbaspirillum denitrificans]